MKKILACTLALTLTGAMLTSCGGSDDSSSSKAATTATTTTTTAETTTTTTTAATEESVAESTAESTGDSAAAEAKDISEMPETLKNYDEASLKFSTDKTAEDYGFAAMAENDYDGTDESHVELAVEEVAGIPMMKVTILDKDEYDTWKIPKVRFDMSKLFEGQTEDLPKIFTVKMDVVSKAVGTFTADDGTESLVPGNFMGAFVTQTGEDLDSLSWNQLYEFGEAEWTSEWGSYELVMRPGIKPNAVFVDTDTPQYLTIMRWSIPNDACFYIADIRFEDEDGNVILCKNFQ